MSTGKIKKSELIKKVEQKSCEKCKGKIKVVFGKNSWSWSEICQSCGNKESLAMTGRIIDG